MLLVGNYATKPYPVEIKEGKRIIHFAKVRIEDALPIYMKIYASNPSSYPMLNTFIEELQVVLNNSS